MPRKTLRAAAKPADKILAFMATSPVTLSAAAKEGESQGPRTFAINAYNGGQLPLANFELPVVVDLAGATFAKNVIANLNHDSSKIVGHATDKVNDGKSLALSGIVSGASAASKEVVDAADQQFPWEASIEARNLKIERIAANKQIEVNGQSFTGPLLVARKSTIYGVAFCPHGADETTSATIAATAASSEESNMDAKLKAWIEAMLPGTDVDSLSAEAVTNLEANYKSQNGTTKKPPASTKKTVTDIIAAQEAENSRQEGITNLMAAAVQRHPDQLDLLEAMSNAAIADTNYTVEKFELDLLRQERPQAHTVFASRRDSRITNDIIEAAVCKSGGLQNIEKHFDEKVLDASDKAFRTGLTLNELILQAARENGFRGVSVRADIRGALRAAFPVDDDRNIRAAGFSTVSLPTTFSNIANKFLIEGWMSIDPSWRSISSIRAVNDFKTSTSFSLTGGFEYEQLGPGGEIKHAEPGEVVYTNKADTYARMFAVNRTDIINDDLGALTSVPRRLGRGAALKLNKVFWAMFLNNSAFFTSGNSNVATGAGSALSLSALTASNIVFMNQTDPDSQPLGIMPQILLVPTALYDLALTLMKSELVVSGNTASTVGLPNANIWRSRMTVVSSPYMSNSTFTGNSSAAWYMLAAPSDLPVIETCFLNGREAPVVETAEADFSTLGIQMRGYHDFGVNLQEYRGGVRNAGS